MYNILKKKILKVTCNYCKVLYIGDVLLEEGKRI